MMYFARFGGHDAVKLVVRREPVDERNDDVAIEKQALPFHGIGDIGQLIIRNAQMPRENLAVARRLIEHVDEVAVFKDVLDLAAGQQVLDVLRDSGGNAAPLAESLPHLHGIGCRLRLLEQKVELIDVIARRFCLRTVGRDAAPHLILHDEHAELLKLRAQLLDVIADQTVLHIDIGAMVEHIERAGHVDFQHRRNPVRFLFVLRKQHPMQIAERRHVLRARIVDIRLIDQRNRSVDYCAVDALDTVLAAHNQLAQRQNKVAFQAYRRVRLKRLKADIQRIDVIRAVGRYADDLPLEALHKRVILAFRIADHDVILRCKEAVYDLALCGKRFA